MATAKIIVFHPERCRGCLDCEKACSKVHHRNDKGADWSAIRISETGNSYAMTNCNMCGLCIDMCPVLAIARKSTGTVVLDRKICVGCQACVGFCPRNVMRKAPGVITPFKCIACGACVRACPEKALELKEVKIDEIREEVYSKHGRVCR
jgi:Fe-S-cluster-containing hydrogenase component 2